MLRRLLKYDMKSILRVWWIIAVSVVGLAAIGSIALRYVIDHGNDDGPALLLIFAMLVAFMSFIGITAASFLSSVLVYIRFYKNFFTDEGYLTFTLPVSRSQLLLSKTLNAMIWTVAQTALIFISVAAIAITALMSPASGVEFSDFIASCKEFMYYMWQSIGAWCIVYAFLAFVILILCQFMSVCVIQFCITVGAIIVKKAKVIVAVGIYYAGNLSFAIIYRIVSICMMYGFGGGGVNLDAISEREWYFVIFLLLLLISLIIAAASMALYLFTQNRLERKLNLA